MWYDDPVMVVSVVIMSVGFSYLVYRIIKEIWDRL